MDKVKLIAFTNVSGHLESDNQDDLLDKSDIRLIKQIIANKKPLKKDTLKDRLVKIVERTLLDDVYYETVILQAQFGDYALSITMTRNERRTTQPNTKLPNCIYRYVGFNKYDMLLTYTINTTMSIKGERSS